jgi:histidine ammonia-lyase
VTALDGTRLTLADVERVAHGAPAPALSAEARGAMQRSRDWVEATLGAARPVYGVNTGFGSLARVPIAAADSAALSRNLVRSHAAGVGPPCPREVVRAMMLLRANALARGASGCRPALVDTLVTMLDAGVVPIVPRQGSCGASGDLAPLSHLGLVLFGEGGRAWLGDEELDGPVAMARAGIPTLTPGAKEGLAITNGAQLTTAIAAIALQAAGRTLAAAEVAAAMSVEALRGVTRAFAEPVHRLRPHPGALAVAARMRALLAGSTLVDSLPGKVQDAYSLRCTPTVLGAAREALGWAERVVAVELNSVTDNPVILVDEQEPAYSAGLFHGEPIGIVADTARLALAEVASISERRLYRLTTGSLSARLPPALAGADRPGLGMLVPQTAAAALVSENKALCWPATADSIPTCEDQEDHVAMSTTAAWRLREVGDNTARVVAIELLCAARALRFRLDEDPGAALGAGAARALPILEQAVAGHRAPAEQIEAIYDRLRAGEFA